MDLRKALTGIAVAGIATIGTCVIADSASAAVTEQNGNTNPQSQNQAGQCAAGQRWVFASTTANANYNPLAKTTDSLGANSLSPPNANADQFNDGVTVAIDGRFATVTVDEAADPNTTIAITKIVVKAGNHFTVYTGGDAVLDSPLSSPASNPSMGISHAFACYSVNANPTPVVSESAIVALLSATGATVGIAHFALAQRRKTRRDS